MYAWIQGGKDCAPFQFGTCGEGCRGMGCVAV